MESIPALLDLVIGVLQIVVVLFLAYGAYLATRETAPGAGGGRAEDPFAVLRIHRVKMPPPA